MTLLVFIYGAVTFLPMVVMSRKGYQKKEIAMLFVITTLSLFVWMSIILKHPFSPDTIAARIIDRIFVFLP